MKKIRKYGCFIIIIIVGIIDLIYGVYTWYQKESFLSNAKDTTAHIDMISRNKNNYLLHIHYYIKSKKYTNIMVTNDSNIKISDSIKIYYEVANPKKISNGEIYHIEGVIIILGVLFISLGFFLIFRNSKKRN